MHSKDSLQRGGVGVPMIIIGAIILFIIAALLLKSPDESVTPATSTELADPATEETPVTTNDTTAVATPSAPAAVEEEMMDDTMEKDETEDKMDDEDKMMDDEPQSDSVETSAAAPAAAPLVAGVYTDYSPELLANADDGDVVVFFHAQWCSTCKALEQDITANTVPAGVTILKADFDTDTDLKKKYGVVRQHTVVKVDANGDLIETLTGRTNTLEQVVSQL